MIEELPCFEVIDEETDQVLAVVPVGDVLFLVAHAGLIGALGMNWIQAALLALNACFCIGRWTGFFHE